MVRTIRRRSVRQPGQTAWTAAASRACEWRKVDHDMFRYRWKEGTAHAPQHEVYGQVIADKHGGDPRKYAAWIRTQPDPLEAVRILSGDRQKAWDVLIGVET